MEIDSILQKSKTLNKVSECVSNNIRLSLSCLQIGEKALTLYYLNKRCIVVCNDILSLNMLKTELVCLGKKVGELDAGYPMPVFAYKQENLSMCEFLGAVCDYYLGKTDILLVLADALFQRLPSLDFFKKFIGLKTGATYNFLELEKLLTNIGYTRCEKVTKRGEFSIRGDIIDIFTINSTDPVRLDFFGDTLEKIYSFDVDLIEKKEIYENINIYPATLYLFDEENKTKILDKLNNDIKQKINDNYLRYSEIKSHYENAIENKFIDISDSFILPYFGFKDNIISLFKSDLIVFDEPKKIFDNLYKINNNNIISINNSIQNNELLNAHKKYFYEIENNFNINNYLLFDNFNNTYFSCDENINFRNIGSRKYLFDYKALIKDISVYCASSYSCILFCGSKSSVDSIGKYLITNNLTYQTKFNPNINKSQIVLLQDELPFSASFLEAGLVLIGTSDLVKKVKQSVVTQKQGKRSAFYLPKVGDYVVHEVHGIGKCVGLENLNLNGSYKDYFIVQYKNGDLLYVPSEQTNTLSAFLGSDKTPVLNKIGGQEFERAKEKVKQAVKKLAINLVELYKQRENEKGIKYESDSLMELFENSFEYDLTSDQQNAVNDIKSDLYSGKLMDRLICGDVGYGKTEVALRAAYQVVLGGKQVAFLCPTTILSEQHFKTATKRLKDFVCNIKVLNRFKTKTEQEEILKGVKSGDVDILIGTHRLLSNDVIFKDLGLLILDEEHRFGVADKEKIKTLKKDVDVLTLSATPIPRTLNMALTGIRDISVIETPPKNRIAVQTYVTEESESLICDAIKREMSRDGQVLIVYNKVDTIYDFAKKISLLVPNARIGIAHGQMHEKLLEDTIFKLYNGEYDILIATTLIENGIDLPMANTLIVIDADRLGLSQLYQLKGRIGRSDRMAYAYFTFNPNKILSTDAYKRLDAIMEFTELGSGFKIAMRDLEIRGAGNVLGKEQHGHMEKVGYELYCKLLDEAVNELKGKKEKETKPIKIDIVCPAYIPEDYISDEQDKIKYYDQISKIDSIKEMVDVKNHLSQAFGEVPSELCNLLKIALIKNLGAKLYAKRILLSPTVSKIYLYPKQEIVSKEVANVLHDRKDVMVLKFEDVPIIEMNLSRMSVVERLDYVIKFLNDCINDWFLIDFFGVLIYNTLVKL